MTLPNTRFPLVSQSKASVNFSSQSEARKLRKIQMLAEKAGYTSTLTFTLNAFLCSEKNSSNISHASDNTCNYII